MLSAIYQDECSNCKGGQECNLCRDSLCKACAVLVGGEYCCRPCSASIRNDEGLVSYFIKWHRSASLGDVVLSKAPTLLTHKYMKGGTFSVAEFETENIIGSVTFRSDAQSDAEAIYITTEESVFHEYRILVNESEIDQFLASVYTSIQRECSK